MSKIFVIILVIILIIIGGYWYFYIYYPKQQYQLFLQKYQTAEKYRNNGNISESLTAYEEALKLAPNIDSATQIKFNIAFATFTRNQGNDRINSSEMLKAIINDTFVSALQRAIAITELLDMYYGTHDETFARNVIFSGEPLGKFLENNNIELALRKANEMADSLYSLPLQDFHVAIWYGDRLKNNEAENELQKKEFISKLIQWTEKGESAIPQTLSLGYPNSKLGFIYIMQGIVRKNIADFTNRDYALSETAFKNGLEILSHTDKTDVLSYGMELFLRFHYAAMIAEEFGIKRRTDIEEILKPILEPVPPQFEGYPFQFYEALKNETLSGAHLDKSDIKRLSELIPEFKKFLDRRELKY